MSNTAKIQLMASLEDAIQKWLENQCASGEYWPHNVVLGEDISFIMMRAAFAVLEGIGDAQEFAIEQELLFEPLYNKTKSGG